MEWITSKVFKVWSWYFFSKCAEFYVDFKNTKSITENIFCFGDNSAWTYCGSLSQFWPKYMQSTVYLLPNNPKIWDLTERYVFYLNLSRINGKLGKKCCCADFVSVWDPWKHWFPKGILKQKLSAIQVTTFFGVNNFQIV